MKHERVTINQPALSIDELGPAGLDQAARARWLADLDLRERFVSLPDYAHRLQQMRLGLVPMDATILP